MMIPVTGVVRKGVSGMAEEYKCQSCGKTSTVAKNCCGVPMKKVS